MPGPARFVLVGALAVGLLAGCSGGETTQALDPEVVNLQPGAPGEPNAVLSEIPVDDEVFPTSPFSDADVAFMRDMQVHHEQALAMTALVGERTEREDLRLFVRRMEISQTAEIELLDRLLAEHESAVIGGDDHADGHADDHADGHADMPGMLSPDEMAALEAASGDDFVRRFLVAMTRHHEGALIMVADLLETDGAASDPRLAQFAQHVDSDQKIEIERMARMYAELSPA